MNLGNLAIFAILVTRLLAGKKNPFYFCDFCGHFEALVSFFFFKVLNLVTFVILAIFALFVTRVLS